MGSCATDKSDMPARSIPVEDYQARYLAEQHTSQILRREIEVLNQSITAFREQLSNLETRYKRESELTTAYRRVIKDLSEGV